MTCENHQNQSEATFDALSKALAIGTGISEATEVFTVERIERIPRTETDGKTDYRMNIIHDGQHNSNQN